MCSDATHDRSAVPRHGQDGNDEPAARDRPDGPRCSSRARARFSAPTIPLSSAQAPSASDESRGRSLRQERSSPHSPAHARLVAKGMALASVCPASPFVGHSGSRPPAAAVVEAIVEAAPASGQERSRAWHKVAWLVVPDGSRVGRAREVTGPTVLRECRGLNRAGRGCGGSGDELWARPQRALALAVSSACALLIVPSIVFAIQRSSGRGRPEIWSAAGRWRRAVDYLPGEPNLGRCRRSRADRR
jgi:hypothetical protein